MNEPEEPGLPVEDVIAEMYSRLANLEKLTIHLTECLIAFMPSDASEKLMEDFMNFSQALKSMPLFGKQQEMQAAEQRDGNEKSH